MVMNKISEEAFWNAIERHSQHVNQMQPGLLYKKKKKKKAVSGVCTLSMVACLLRMSPESQTPSLVPLPLTNHTKVIFSGWENLCSLSSAWLRSCLQTAAKQGQSLDLEIKTVKALVIPQLTSTVGSKLTVIQWGMISWIRFHRTLSTEEVLGLRGRVQNREKFPNKNGT